MTRICVTYAKLKSWKEKKLFENCVLLTGDKNFLYIRMKKMVITKTHLLGLGIQFSNSSAADIALRHLSGMPFFLLTI